MPKFSLYDKLSKDYVFTFISQQDIMEYYLGITVQFDELVCSPLRPDSYPTAGFRYSNNNILRFRDFNGHFWGDCFDVVAFRIQTNRKMLEFYNIDYCDSKNKQHFAIILDVIARDFRLAHYSITPNLSVNNYTKPSPESSIFKKKPSKFTKIYVEYRDWNKYDIEYWTAYHLKRTDLEEGDVLPAYRVWIEKEGEDCKLIYTYQGDQDLCFAYYFGMKDDINQFKIYFPNRKENRFVSNNRVLQGARKLTLNKEFVVVTKSYKDVLCFRSFGIDAVAPAAESILLTANQVQKLRTHYDYVFSLMDYDNTGIRMSLKLLRVYGISPIFMTEYPLRISMRKKGYLGCKDFADYLKKFGVDETQALISHVYYELIGKHNQELTNLLNYIQYAA